jgi:hypothetical protein
MSKTKYYETVHKNCSGCKRDFNKDVKHAARGYCNRCYLRQYNKDKGVDFGVVKKSRLKQEHCSCCQLKFGSLNSKNKEVILRSSNLCRQCWYKNYRKNLITKCTSCNAEYDKASSSIHCSNCRQYKRKRYNTQPNVLPTYDEREKIRLLLNRFKHGTQTLVDPFILIDLYMTFYNDDSNTALVTMLRRLKITYDLNKVQKVK